jgi:hypothetical protein
VPDGGPHFPQVFDPPTNATASKSIISAMVLLGFLKPLRPILLGRINVIPDADNADIVVDGQPHEVQAG